MEDLVLVLESLLYISPWDVAVSADKHIFVVSFLGKLQKFSFSSYEASANVSGHGVAIHPSGKIFTTVDD